jgi:hypothetical protein
MAGFKGKGPRSIDHSIWYRKRLERKQCTVYNMFNIVLEKVVRNRVTNLNGTSSKRTRQYIANADDVLILRQSVTATEVVVTLIKEDAVNTGSKTKYMKINISITNLEQDLINEWTNI